MLNANAFIASGVSLLALAAGTFLLVKVTRDNLGPIYKIVAWIIIVGSIVNAGFNAMNCMFRFYHKHMMGHEMRMDQEMKGQMFMHHKMWSHPDAFMENCEGSCRHQGMICGGGTCCNGGMMGGGMCHPDNQGYWKKCYEGLRDSCNRSRVK
jgi:hypothetical protein